MQKEPNEPRDERGVDAVQIIDGKAVHYPPVAYCTTCGKDFSGTTLFDAHRVGVHDYSYAEGLAIESWSAADWKRLLPRVKPEDRAALIEQGPREDGRRCLDEDEMRAKGWRPLTEQEMLAGRHKRRAWWGVELWHDPAAVERIKETFAR